jgi:hypothetical protein
LVGRYEGDPVYRSVKKHRTYQATWQPANTDAVAA